MPDCVIRIAGAGVIGLAVAIEMLHRGRKVEVFDPAAPNVNASGVAAGMLAPAAETLLDGRQSQANLLWQARDRWTVWSQRLGQPIERAGVLFPLDERSPSLLSAAQSINVPLQSLTAAEARARQPWLGAEVAGAAFSEEDWSLDAAEALSAMRRWVEAHGGAIHRAPATAVKHDGPLVIAAGYGAATWAQTLEELACLRPIKGQLLRFKGGPIAGAVLRTAQAYLVPQASGAIVGATMEAGRTDTLLDSCALDRLRKTAEVFVPGLYGLEAAGAAGVRAATPDGLPLVGPSSRPGVLLAVGVRRNGWLLAPLVAEMVAAYLTGEDPGPHAAALDPLRFAQA